MSLYYVTIGKNEYRVDLNGTQAKVNGKLLEGNLRRLNGSGLHLLQREKDLERVALLAEQYAAEALQPIIDDGRAERISVSAEQPHKGRLNLRIRVETAAGGFDYSHGVAVI